MRALYSSFPSTISPTFATDAVTGKSTLCAQIINSIQDKQDSSIAYYFCGAGQKEIDSARGILRSLVTQLLAEKVELAPYILEAFANRGQQPTKKNLSTILEKLMGSIDSVRIILDGLDECSQSEQKEIIQDLNRIRGPTSTACKILISSRKSALLLSLLGSKSAINLEDHAENVNRSIATYVEGQIDALKQRFDSVVVYKLRDNLITKADGKYIIQYIPE